MTIAIMSSRSPPRRLSHWKINYLLKTIFLLELKFQV
jgi:hypothetical protein